MTTSISRDDLVRFLDATGHPPRIIAVSQAGTTPGTPIAITPADTI